MNDNGLAVALDICVQDTHDGEEDWHQATLHAIWPHHRPLPCKGDLLYFDDMILEVTRITHVFDENHHEDVRISADMDGRVDADAWFNCIEADLDSYAVPGMCTRIEKHW